jgi:hypothetical protein
MRDPAAGPLPIRPHRARQAVPASPTISNQAALRLLRSIDSKQSAKLGDREAEVDAAVKASVSSVGRPLGTRTRAFMESRFGRNFGHVRVHTGSPGATAARLLGARAFTMGADIVLGEHEREIKTDRGQALLAHELAHVTQQRAARVPGLVQRDQESPSDSSMAHTGPLTEREWKLVDLWRSRGAVGVEALAGDADRNAEAVAGGIFCQRIDLSQLLNREDPLLCIEPEVTRADPRVRQLIPRVTERGPIVHWAAVAADRRVLRVMEVLVDEYDYPLNGAAGLVGNLWAESGVLPSRVEGSRPQTPMRASDFSGHATDFTAEEVMSRDRSLQQGPRRPGVGLAQWTSPARRSGLFAHEYEGRVLGASILFNMDAQIDYLVGELQSSYPGVHQTLSGQGVTLNDASDDVVYRFEIPGSILGKNGARLPRSHANVQQVFARRRTHARRALEVYRASHLQ